MAQEGGGENQQASAQATAGVLSETLEYTDASGLAWSYWVNDDDTVTVSGYDFSKGRGANVVVPSFIDGKRVTTISNDRYSFEGNGSTSLTLPLYWNAVVGGGASSVFDSTASSLYMPGDYPEGIDWGSFNSSWSNPTVYVPSQYLDNWKAHCTWNVQAYDAPTSVEIMSGGQALGDTLSLSAGETAQLSALNLPESDAYKSFHTAVTWTSSNAAVVQVDESGNITASSDVADGSTAVITAVNGLGQIDAVTVAVANASVAKIDISGCSFFPWHVGDGQGNGDVPDHAYIKDGAFQFDADSITVSYHGQDLTKGVDYTYEYQTADGTPVDTASGMPEALGSYKLVFTGMGGYGGTHEMSFDALGAYQKEGNGPAWAYSYNDDGENGGVTIQYRVRDTTPSLAEDWIIPAYIDGKPVTRIEGNTSITQRYLMNSCNADTLTFPSTLTRIYDASPYGGGVFSNLTFSANAGANGYVFFLGSCPDDIDWRSVSSSDPMLDIYTPAAYVDGWKASLQKAGYNYTTVSAYEVPGVDITLYDPEGDVAPDNVVELYPGQAVEVEANAVTSGDFVYTGHTKVAWTSTDEGTAYASYFGDLICAGDEAVPGSEATLTATNALGESDTLTVRIVEAPVPPSYTDELGINWLYRVNDDDTITITGYANDKGDLYYQDVVMPSIIDGKKVTGIDDADHMFSYVNATTVTMPRYLTTVENASNFFSGAATSGVYFTGECPEGFDWDDFGHWGNPYIQFYVPSEHYDGWRDSFLWGSYYLNAYDAPNGLDILRAGEAVDSVSSYPGKSVQLDAALLPEGGLFKQFHKGISWASSDEAVATVDENGKVMVSADAPAGATATITATSVTGVVDTVSISVQSLPPFKVDIGNLTFTPDTLPEVYCNNGAPIMPKVTIAGPDGEALVEGEDYAVSYMTASGQAVEGTPAEQGSYIMVFTGTDPLYTGTKEMPFTISDDAAVAGWKFSPNVDGATATITGYVGSDGTVVIPGKIAGLTVTNVAPNVFPASSGSTLVAEKVIVPDTVVSVAPDSLAGSNTKTVRFLGAAPEGLGDALGAGGVAVECFADKASEFTSGAAGHPVSGISDNMWVYRVEYDAAGNAQGVLGTSDQTAAYKGSGQTTITAPAEIDGFAMSVIGSYALAGLERYGDDPCLLVKVPDSYAYIEDMAFADTDVAVAFAAKQPLAKLGEGSVTDSYTTLWVPRGDKGAWDAAEWISSAWNVSVSEYDANWDVELVVTPADSDYTSGSWASVVTGYNGSVDGDIASMPYSFFYQNVIEFRDVNIDASNVGFVDMKDAGYFDFALANYVKFTGTFLDNFTGSMRFYEGPPTADDYSTVVNPNDPDKSKVTIYYDPAYEDEWLASGWKQAGYHLVAYSDAAVTSFTYEKTADGEYAVTGYRGSESDIAIPETVEVAGEQGRVTSIAEGAFASTDSALRSIVIPSSVRSIGASAFEGQGSLASVTLSEGLVSIGDRAFWSCNSLAEVNLPASLTTLEGEPFECAGVERFTVSEGSGSFSALDGVLFNKDQTELLVYPLHKTLDRADGLYMVPDTVKTIAPHAFRGVYNDSVSREALRQVFMPTGVETIGDYAFMDREGLEVVNIPSSVTKLGAGVFNSCGALSTVNIDPEKSQLTTISESAFWGCGNLTSFDFPKGLQSVGEDAFQLTGLTSIELPEGLTAIEAGAFASCFDLAQIKLPSTLETIGDAGFSGAAVTELVLPEGLKTIGASAFSQMESLTSLEIPASVTSLGEGFLSMHWNSNPQLASVTFAKGSQITSIPAYAFDCQYSLASITIPDTVTSVGECAFRDNSGLKSVVFLNKGAWEMDDNAFFQYLTTVSARIYGYTTSSSPQNAETASLGFYPIDVVQTSPLPNTVRVKVGENVQLQSEVTTENGELSYQWFVNNEAVDASSAGPNKYEFAPDAPGVYVVTLQVTNSYDPDHPTRFSCVVTAEGETPDPDPDPDPDPSPDPSPAPDPDPSPSPSPAPDATVVDLTSAAHVEAVPDQAWTGFPIEPSLVVRVGAKTLVEGADYTVSYASNVDAGVATATVSGKGSYSGVVKVEFNIVRSAVSFVDVPADAWYADVVGEAAERGLVSGYSGPDGMPTGYFGPDDALTRGQAAIIFAHAAGVNLPEAASNATPFTDVEDGAYYAAAVNWAYKQGVMNGYGPDYTTVRPDAPVTREELACMAYNFAKLQGADMSASSQAYLATADWSAVSGYAADALVWATDKGVINGKLHDGQRWLDPQAQTSRAEMAAIAVNMVKNVL